MKKLINSPDDVVSDALAGIAAAHPGLSVDPKARVITRAAQTRIGKVALVSGGGSGHEPLHGGFVGTGMLDAACPGEVFTSPVPDQMLAAAKAVDGGAGVVFVVKNYTGDVLNFRMAAEFAEYRPWKTWAQFDKEIGKYVGQQETDRFKQYVFIPPG